MLTLADRRLYLCVGARDDVARLVRAALDGGVDVVQLRDKSTDRSRQLVAGRLLADLCRDAGVPFIVNDDPTLAADLEADGVHVGQDDVPVERCRAVLGDQAIVGLSTHAPAELARARGLDATYLSAGPIVPTPTKPGRAGTGVAYAVEATRTAGRPVFVTGGVGPHNVADLVAAGMERFVVVRAVVEAADPRRAAAAVRQRLDEALAARSAVAVEPAEQGGDHPGVGPQLMPRTLD